MVGKLRPQPQVLRLENDGTSSGVEQNLSCRNTGNGKGEWLVDYGEFEVLIRELEVVLGMARPWQHGLRDLVDLLSSVVYLDMQALLC